MRALRWLPFAILLGVTAPALAQQINAARLAIVDAEDRRAPAAADVARLRAGLGSADPLTARVAIRAIGRLERPALIADLLPALGSRHSDVRAEAATAVAQAAAGLRRGASGGPTPAALLQTLRARLAQEEEPSVRAALAESLARLPYSDSESLALVQQTLAELSASRGDVLDRLGLAKAFEVFVRVQAKPTLTATSLGLLRALVGLASAAGAEPLGGGAPIGSGTDSEPLRDARVRRLALEALTTAGSLDAELVEHAWQDVDPQVRRLAVRAAARSAIRSVVTAGLEDPMPMVRLEAVRGLSAVGGEDTCAWTLAATTDADAHVMLRAIDELRGCGRWDHAVTRLADLASDTEATRTVRGWHASSHALVALATAAPARAATALQVHATSSIPFVRMYAARAAQTLEDRETLERLARDSSDNVIEAALEGLAATAAGAALPVYLTALARPGYQAVRAAARALMSASATPEALRALTQAHERLTAEGRDNSTDARAAIEEALRTLGAPLPDAVHGRPAARTPISPTLEELRRLAAPRARLTIRGLGIIDVALITLEAPLTVVQFARLAESGYYDGLTIHRVVPNFVFQGGSPDANEYVGHPNHMRDEVGQWPHVRGALGVSTRGRDTGDAQFFISLVDNPRLDHEYTAFGQVLAGMEVADRILEGDVIESVSILAR